MSSLPEEMSLYGFVVLNYNNYYDTIACVDSILRIRHRDDYRIVIVDNASSNNSVVALKKMYGEHAKIEFAITDENTGYSGGNNVGLKILRDIGINRFIIATNDTEVVSLDLLDEFDKIDIGTVGIVGPDILSLDGAHQNPPLYQLTFIYLLNLYFYAPMVWMRAKIYKHIPVLANLRRSAKAKNLEKFTANGDAMNGYSVYMLHGCFMYLTKTYIEKVGLLDENLFMYGEEDLMAWNCTQHQLLEWYLPSVKVLHKDAQATKLVHQKGKDDFVRAMTMKAIPYLTKRIKAWHLIKHMLTGSQR